MKTTDINLEDGRHIVVTVNGSGGTVLSNLKVNDPEEDTSEYNAAIDGMESLILALACTGQFNLKSPAFKEAIVTTLDAIENNFD